MNTKQLVKKILAVLLTLLLTVGTLPIMASAATSDSLQFDGDLAFYAGMEYENTYFSFPYDSVDDYKPISLKQENLLDGADISMETVFSNGGTGTGTWTDPAGTVYPALYANSQNYDTNQGLDDNGVYKFVSQGCGNEEILRSLEAFGNGDYMELVFSLENEVTPSAFALINLKEKQFQTAYYELYGAYDRDDLVKSTSLLGVYDPYDIAGSGSLPTEEGELGDSRQINLFEFENVGKIRYFRMVIKHAEPLSTARSVTFRALRLALFGTKGEPNSDKKVISDNSQILPTENLLTATDVFSTGTLYSKENLQDGNTTGADAGYGLTFATWDDEKGIQFISDGSQTATFSYDLGALKEVSGVALFSHSSKYLRTYDYELYAANDKDVLYNPANRIAHFVNTLGDRRQIFDFSGDSIHARYVGLRVIFPYFDKEEKFFDLTKSNYANYVSSRIVEFRVFGTDSDATVGMGEIFNNFENVNGYTDAKFPIVDTGDADHGKALLINGVDNVWYAIDGKDSNLGSYVSGDRMGAKVFGETVNNSQDYIVSFDHKLVQDNNPSTDYVFQLGIYDAGFGDDPGKLVAKGELNKWKTAAFGFTAGSDKAYAKINTAGQSKKTYLDNYSIDIATDVVISAADGDVSVNAPANESISFEVREGIIVTPQSSTNGKFSASTKGALSFKLNYWNGYNTAAVKMGTEPITPDEDGYFNIDVVAAPITVELSHTHKYENIEKKENEKTPATCTAGAEYYKSCDCGAKSVETFLSDKKAAHTFSNVVNAKFLKSAATCQSPAVYYKSCKCGTKSTATFTSGDKDVNNHSYTKKNADKKYRKTASNCKSPARYYYSCACGAHDSSVTAKTFEYGKPAAHTTKQVVTEATHKADGKIVKKCTVCGKSVSTTKLYKVSKITLSKEIFTYNGKTQKPTVTVKNQAGKKLVKNVDYTISLPKSSKSIKNYTITVKFKGNYKGSVKVKYAIAPKGTTVSSLAAVKKSLKVTLKKQTKNTSGYELQYSTSKSFKSAKISTVKKNSTTKATLKKLKARKTYYVRVRTYKTVSGKRVYSAWSKAKAKKTK